MSATLFNAWRRAVERVADRQCTAQAWHLEAVSDHMGVGNYLTKLAGIPYELTSSMTKTGGNRTIWGILRDISRADRAGEEPAEADVRLWRRYVVAIKGRRAIDLGGKARDLLRDRPDEEPKAVELLAVVGPQGYRAVRSGGLQGPLLAGFEAAGAMARAEAAALLTEAEREGTRTGAIGWVKAAIGHLVRGLPP